MKRRGFTIVELIITITIMGILLTLAIVNVGVTQTQSRDTKRKGDIDAISSALEDFYVSGTTGTVNFARYPSQDINASTAALTTNLRDTNLKSFMAPGITDPMITFIAATNAVQSTAGVLPQPTKDQYVYQPIKSDGTICAVGDIDCRKFNLYYRLEIDNNVYQAMSKNQ